MNVLSLLLVKTAAENQRIDSQRALQLGLLASVVPPPMGVAVGLLAANREAPPPGRGPAPDSGGGQTGGGQPGGETGRTSGGSSGGKNR